MPDTPCLHPSPTRDLTPADLESLAEHLVGSHRPAPRDPVGSALVRARPTPDGMDLALCPLPAGTHPADVLLGHVVPRRWSAAGVVAPATARDLRSHAGAARSITVAVLLGRDGTLAHRGTGAEGCDALPRDPAPAGRLIDLLHRALELPTPPPATCPRELWETLWLDAVVADAAAGDGSDALAPELAQALSTTFAPEGRDGWSHLRRLAATPRSARGRTDVALAAALAPLVGPTAAAWMDDGCFARWVMGELPARDDLLEVVDALLPPTRSQAVRVALGLPAGLPPIHPAR